MTKKILAIVVAAMMVMALSVVAFADADLTADVSGTLNDNVSVAIPEGANVADGATFTVTIKGTSDNTTVRLYLSDAADGGRVTDVYYAEVVDGAFEATLEMLIDTSGAIQGTAEPTHLWVKGPSWDQPLANTVIESLVIVGVDAVAGGDDDNTTNEPDNTTNEPSNEGTTTAPNTGLALAVVPAVVALAAVAVSKKH